MYMLLTGKPPFDGFTEIDIIKKVRNKNFPYKPLVENGVSDECIHLIGCLLEKNPKERYSAKQALGHIVIRLNYYPLLGIRKNFKDTMVNI